MTHMGGGGAKTSIEYYESEATRERRERRKRERQRFEPIRIPTDPRPFIYMPGDPEPTYYKFSSRVDEGIEPKTKRRATLAVDLYEGKLLDFYMDGTEDELRALIRACRAKLNEIVEDDDGDL